jgi:hypothetical protein
MGLVTLVRVSDRDEVNLEASFPIAVSDQLSR